jgi:hypothetical protein
MLPCIVLVANVIQAPLPFLREPCVLCVETHLQLRPAASAHLTAKSRRIRTSPKHTPNPCRIRSFKTQDLKPFRMRSCRKTGVLGVLLLTRNPTKDLWPEQISGVKDLSFHPSAKDSSLVGRDLPFPRRRQLASHYSLPSIHYSLRPNRAVAESPATAFGRFCDYDVLATDWRRCSPRKCFL